MKFIEDPAGTILPTIGIIFDFWYGKKGSFIG
jgi:hypothetical protein